MYFQNVIAHHHTWTVLILLNLLVLVVATFISHTVSAVILLPVVDEIGKLLPDNESRVLVMAAALMCSCAMGLPVSGFPNMNAIMLEDRSGKRYLKSMDFIKNGIPASVLCFSLVSTLGYALMWLVGF